MKHITWTDQSLWRANPERQMELSSHRLFSCISELRLDLSWWYGGRMADDKSDDKSFCFYISAKLPDM